MLQGESVETPIGQDTNVQPVVKEIDIESRKDEAIKLDHLDNGLDASSNSGDQFKNGVYDNNNGSFSKLLSYKKERRRSRARSVMVMNGKNEKMRTHSWRCSPQSSTRNRRVLMGLVLLLIVFIILLCGFLFLYFSAEKEKSNDQPENENDGRSLVLKGALVFPFGNITAYRALPSVNRSAFLNACGSLLLDAGVENVKHEVGYMTLMVTNVSIMQDNAIEFENFYAISNAQIVGIDFDFIGAKNVIMVMKAKVEAIGDTMSQWLQNDYNEGSEYELSKAHYQTMQKYESVIVGKNYQISDTVPARISTGVSIVVLKFPSAEIPTPFPSGSPNEGQDIIPTVISTAEPSSTNNTTQQPTTAIPTLKPTVSPQATNPTDQPTEAELNPTIYPTTLAPTPYPTTYVPTTFSPTPFPSVPFSSSFMSNIQCNAEAFDFTMINLVQDTGFDDFVFDSNIASAFTSQIQSILKHRASNFRFPHPNPSLSLLGLLSGKYPHTNNYAALNLNIFGVSMIDMLNACGIKAFFFGDWQMSLNGANITSFPFYETFVSKDPLAVSAALSNYLAAYQNVILANSQKHLVFVLWPKMDIYNNVGANLANFYDPASNTIAGMSGPLPKNGAICRDVLRDEDSDTDDDSSGGSGPRYSVCNAQLYAVNQYLGCKIIGATLSSIESLFTSSKSTSNGFLMLTSVSGKAAPSLDPNSATKSQYRGMQNSLYEGGLRTRLFYNSYVNRDIKTYKDYNMNRNAAVEVLGSLNGVDLAKLISARMGVIIPATGLSYLDGEDISSYLFGSFSQTYVARTVPQVYENNYIILDQCIADSPRFAIIDDTGRFKLLIEPPVSSALASVVTDNYRVEFYDLGYASYELTNWINATTTSSSLNTALSKVVNSLYAALVARVTRIELLPYEADSEIGPHLGCSKLFLPEQTVSNPETDILQDELDGIIILLADDMAQADVSLYGKIREANTRSRDKGFFFTETPNIDSIARVGGTVFTNFYANSPVCSPSRAALLTAKLPSHTFNKMHSAIAVTNSANPVKGTIPYLGDGTQEYQYSMNTFFKKYGFITGHFGKWHLGFDGPYVDDPMYSLDEFQVYTSHLFPDNKKQRAFNISGSNDTTTYDLEFNNRDTYFSGKSSELIVNRTIQFIAKRIAAKQKYIVNVWLQSAHAPLNLVADEDQIAKYNYSYAGNIKRNDSLSLQTSMEVYRTLVNAQDHSVGRLLQFLEDNDKMKNVAILYASDNGGESPDKYFNSQGNSLSHYRGYKRSLFEGGLRIPGLFRFGQPKPDVTKGPNIVHTPMSLVDVFPTLASIAGLKDELAADIAEQKAANPDVDSSVFELQGKDMSCLWLQSGNCKNVQVARETEPVIFEWRETNKGGGCLGWSSRFAARIGDYKVHLEPSRATRRQVYSSVQLSSLESDFSRIEVYNITDDPAEMTNLWLIRSGDSSMSAAVLQVVTKLVTLTASSVYDTTLFPKSRSSNVDVSLASFATDLACSVSNPPNARTLPTISSSLLAQLQSSILV